MGISKRLQGEIHKKRFPMELCGSYRKEKGPMAGCLPTPWEARDFRKWLQSGSAKPPRGLLDSIKYLDAQDHSQPHLVPGYEVGIPASRAAAAFLCHGNSLCSELHGHPQALPFGFLGSNARKWDHQGVRGFLPGLGASCLKGANISSNNSIGIATRVPWRDLPSLKSHCAQISPKLGLPLGDLVLSVQIQFTSEGSFLL